MKGATEKFLILILIFQEVKSAVVTQCINPNKDQGVCTHPETCFTSKGIFLGKCPSETEVACCLKLPCSTDLEQHMESFRKKRKKRSLITSLISTDIDDRCGLKTTLKVSSSITSRSSQILNAFKVNWENNPYPWMLGLWMDQQNGVIPSCGAALISTRHAITAAHCITNPKNLVLRGGSVLNELPDDEDPLSWHLFTSILDIQSVKVHPKFDPFTYENDIALITLKEDIWPSRDLFPICLPDPVQDDQWTDYEGMEVAVTGWGCMKEQCQLDEQPKHLRELDMHIISNELAMCWFMNDSVIPGSHEYIPKKLFIVGGDESGSKSTCQGDSGSPVVRPVQSTVLGTKYEVIGLVSWSKGCGRPFRPSVWTRVETFVPWIEEHMKSNSVSL